MKLATFSILNFQMEAVLPDKGQTHYQHQRVLFGKYVNKSKFDCA